MPLFRNRNTIKSDKHEQTFTELATDASTTRNVNLYTGVSVGDKDTAIEVAVGSHVRWVYCEINFAAQVITNPKTVHWTIRIVPPAASPSVPSQMYQIDRSYVLKRGMEMLPKDVSTVYKRIFVVRIPRAYQRVKEGQKLEFEYVSSSSEQMNSCGIFIYKEIY